MATRAVFTYRCWESEESNDAELWHRTGQEVEVIRELRYPEVDEDDIGGPMFRIRFADGFEGTAWNDEITWVVPVCDHAACEWRGPCGLE